MAEISNKSRLMGVAALVLAGGLALTGCAGGDNDNDRDNDDNGNSSSNQNNNGGENTGSENTGGDGGFGNMGGDGDGPVETEEFQGPENRSVFEVEEGECIANSEDAMVTGEGQQVTDLDIVPCSQPHALEAYHVADVDEPSDGKYPGEDAINQAAQDMCVDAFDPYVGTSFEESRFTVQWLTPSSGSWDADDREVICMLYDVNLAEGENPETGSAEGSGE